MIITVKALIAMYESVAIPGSVQMQDMEKTGRSNETLEMAVMSI